uniref:Uncharacterized protein n=1 Tax=Nelumbo nucifera TaxID=4432 RepID=A0A822Z7N2_NELNU|nr:TPA_asm: hypothetical protein HUJ06_008149 [Nelumbo nucifera]
MRCSCAGWLCGLAQDLTAERWWTCSLMSVCAGYNYIDHPASVHGLMQ